MMHRHFHEDRDNEFLGEDSDSVLDLFDMTHYLDKLEWDGQPRLRRWLIDLCGAKGDNLEQVGQEWMVSAVTRAYAPTEGVEVPGPLVLSGAQGVGKSRLLDAVSPDVVVAQMTTWSGLWNLVAIEPSPMVVEWSSASLEPVTLLNTLRQGVYSYRDIFTQDNVRKTLRCVFVVTTTAPWETAPASGSNVWGVTVKGPVQFEKLEAQRDQLWAEAKSLFLSGYRFTMPHSELKGA